MSTVAAAEATSELLGPSTYHPFLLGIKNPGNVPMSRWYNVKKVGMSNMYALYAYEVSALAIAIDVLMRELELCLAPNAPDYMPLAARSLATTTTFLPLYARHAILASLAPYVRQCRRLRQFKGENKVLQTFKTCERRLVGEVRQRLVESTMLFFEALWEDMKLCRNNSPECQQLLCDLAPMWTRNIKEKLDMDRGYGWRIKERLTGLDMSDEEVAADDAWRRRKQAYLEAYAKTPLLAHMIPDAASLTVDALLQRVQGKIKDYYHRWVAYHDAPGAGVTRHILRTLGECLWSDYRPGQPANMIQSLSSFSSSSSSS